MKNKRIVCCSLLILLMGMIYSPVQAQQKQDAQAVYHLDVKKSNLFWKAPKNRHNGFTLFGEADTGSENKVVMILHGPKGITRNVIQDRKGNIWIASWEG